jgi:predicted RNA-binding Zn ribbon-like protein
MIDLDHMRALQGKKLVRPEQKRRAVDFLRQRTASIARACRVTGLARSTYSYRGTRTALDAPVVERMKELVARHRRFGVPRSRRMESLGLGTEAG